jgi:hypothetical protein
MPAAFLNFVGYQLVWFVAVLGAGAGHWQPALWAGATFAALQLWFSRMRQGDLRLVAVALALGLLIDGLLARSAWLHYAVASPALPPGGAPLWILVLWVSFALTLNHSLQWLAAHRSWAILLGVIGGPLAYLGAARLSGAVTFGTPAWPALAVLAVGWGIAMAVLARPPARAAAGTETREALP